MYLYASLEVFNPGTRAIKRRYTEDFFGIRLRPLVAGAEFHSHFLPLDIRGEPRGWRSASNGRYYLPGEIRPGPDP